MTKSDIKNKEFSRSQAKGQSYRVTIWSEHINGRGIVDLFEYQDETKNSMRVDIVFIPYQILLSMKYEDIGFYQLRQ